MSDPAATFSRLRALSAFEGDSAAAGRALHDHFLRRWPGIALALLLVRTDEPGRCRIAGLIGPDGAELVPSSDPFGERTDLPEFDDPLALRCIGQYAPRIVDVTPAERNLAFGQALLAPAALLVLPMPVVGQAEHWLIAASTARNRFDGIDLDEALRDAALTFALLTRPLALRTLADRSRRQHREIEGLADVQRLLQPDNPPIRGLRYAIHWQPAETAAGDYYDLSILTPFTEDYVECGADVWGVVIGDVSGHGAAAAMEAVQFDAILRTYEGNEPPLGPAGALTYVNRYFFSRRNRRHFMTIVVATHRPDRGGLQYVCAGHPPAIVRRGGTGAVEWLGREHDAGIPMGILRDHRWENSQAAFGRGDVLVVYTDGLVEAKDRSGRMFGAERIAERVGAGSSDPDSVRARVLEALFEHQGGKIGTDDQTLIVLQQDG